MRKRQLINLFVNREFLSRSCWWFYSATTMFSSCIISS